MKNESDVRQFALHAALTLTSGRNLSAIELVSSAKVIEHYLLGMMPDQTLNWFRVNLSKQNKPTKAQRASRKAA